MPRGDLQAGALALVRAIQYLPPGVALAVVDPGVGTARRAVALETPWGFFVGPDNGLLAPAVAVVGGAREAVSLEDPRFRLPAEGPTFAGRDLFAPAAAVLASGQASLADLGPAVAPESLVPYLLALADTDGEEVRGRVWWIDHFGNCETNVAPDDLRSIGLELGGRVAVRLGGQTREMPWEAAYGEARPGGIVHVDSYGLIALAVPGGRADEALGLAVGSSVSFCRAG